MRKKIYVNLKRFDVPAEAGGVNHLISPLEWGTYLGEEIQKVIEPFKSLGDFTTFFPEAHLINALNTLRPTSSLAIGCQSVFREDIVPNFGAFTTNRPAKAMTALGVTDTIIGHCEERNDHLALLQQAGQEERTLVNKILNQQVKVALVAGLEVLYCVGETADEQGNWQEVLKEQLELGLNDVDVTKVVIAYEPVWAIGPGKTPPDREYIQKIAKFIKAETNNLPVVYGGGLKEDNAEMLASIPEVDGGLIALTRFNGEIGFYPDEFGKIIKKYLV